jgi:hypothetical protein
MRFGQFPVLIMLGKIQSSRLAGCHRDGPLRIASLNRGSKMRSLYSHANGLQEIQILALLQPRGVGGK